MVLKITHLLRFFMHLQMTKRYRRKEKYTIQYVILTLLLRYSLITPPPPKKSIYKKTVISPKFNKNANTYEKSRQQI